MKVFAIVPVKKFENAKTRLSPALSSSDRAALSSLMLEETLKVLAATDRLDKVIVVSSDRRARTIASAHGADFLSEERDTGVARAVELANNHSQSQQADATVVIPLDLPLIDSEEVSKACDLAEGEEKCVVICPSVRYDGTNLLLRKPPDVIPTSYDMNSYQNHLAAARRLGIAVKVFLSEKLMLDIDTPADTAVLEDEGHDNRIAEFIRCNRNLR